MAENAGKTTILEDEEAEKMEDRQFHINCAAGEIGKYVLLTGDPDRVPEIAAQPGIPARGEPSLCGDTAESKGKPDSIPSKWC